MATIKKPFKIFNKAANTWNKYHLETDSTQVTHTKADGTDTTVAEQLLALNSTLLSKNDLTNGGYQMHFYTINTNYSDRVEALKDSLKNRPDMFAVGVNIVYVISSNDDRGVGIIIKKNDSRCAFKYFDYWGENQFWILTSAGWEKKA